MTRFPAGLIRMTAFLGIVAVPVWAMAQTPPPEPGLFDKAMSGKPVPDITLPGAALPVMGEVQERPGPVPAPNEGTPVAAPGADGQPAVASLPAEAVAAIAPVSLSIGDFDASLMYSSEDINNLRQVLVIYETHTEKQVANANPNAVSTPQDSDLLAELLRAKESGQAAAVDSKAALPNFYLGTIIFERPGDWSVWINRQPMTSKKPENAALGLTVISVGNNHATLKWKPLQLAVAIERWEKIKANPALKGLKHREGSESRLSFDEVNGEFTISLHPNQTFIADSMQILEGKAAFMSVATESTEGTTPTAGTTGTEATSAEVTAGGHRRRHSLDEKQLSNELIENTMKMRKLVPQAQPAAN